MIPPAVLAECREEARSAVGQDKPTSWAAAAVIVAIWLLLAVLIVVIVLGIVRG